ncbi:MAG TPA: glycoside hydrolase family 25 protein [Cellvibrionaceae bacterium]|nr:glycoside hydrolase family 25 protein [Cellvibrionaceae bacterium]HMW49129.1 glycoside hydrolase family 25 protein [Cellvibrionaceae bacterium]HMW73030.1 glycoside hydrolase family 25 protein [Cellvibrionaceae bacterium]HMY39628.1 glycoside hydrolase family 25 protein [Marinagarivorans sp.]HNG61355.1 glycoside hydrolase family 25 protein [Cellvibrionaceae bacterium]
MINSVIDISHHNKVASFSKIKNAGIYGIIHKATQGTKYKDPTFTANRSNAVKAGIKVGAYHFGVAGDAIAQAEYLVATAGADSLLVLDFEGNPQGHDMSLDEAEHFVDHINTLTGRYPGLYSGHTIKEALTKAGITNPSQTELAKCWLWIAQYSQAPLVPKIWPRWTLWQYTDGAFGPEPHSLDGIGRCDRDQFNGSLEELDQFWCKNSG